MNRIAKTLLRVVAWLALADLVIAVTVVVLLCTAGPALARGLRVGSLRAARIAVSVADYAAMPAQIAGLSIAPNAGADAYSPVIYLQVPHVLQLDQAE